MCESCPQSTVDLQAAESRCGVAYSMSSREHLRGDLISLGKVWKACWPLDANGQGALPLLAREKVWPAL